MNSAGILAVRASWIDGRVENLAVTLKRPTVTRLFIGQLPDAVVKTVPYLYTLCAEAQRTAALIAVAAGREEAPPLPDHRALWLELLHENLWRLLLDWPVAVGLPPEKDAFVDWRAGRLGDDALVVTRALLAKTLYPLAEKCLEKLAHRSGGVAPAASFDAGGWLAYWRGEADHLPKIQGPSCVAAAYRARLNDVERAVTALAARSPYPFAQAGGQGWGVGQVLTARGILTHAIHVVDDSVANYRVQAPTDGFFADAVPLGALLSERNFADIDAARQGIEQAILALDPCLPHELKLD